MKMLSFARRNRKEMLHDPLTFGFGIGFPLILLLLLSLIQANVPVPMFQIDALTPGVAAFGLSFVSLFSGMTIAKDRANALMLRLLTSPMKASDFILGYTLPLLPLALAQMGVVTLQPLPWGWNAACAFRSPLFASFPPLFCLSLWDFYAAACLPISRCAGYAARCLPICPHGSPAPGLIWRFGGRTCSDLPSACPFATG